ncbi:MFS transporter [Aureimonas altamirensis]|uniref:MFS transporter n=1 Tax=Aureimonas altamirensis TaxID=370622 RepID=A0A0B1Q2F3_9HYPH|nr:MFS transporter [Aureimonas altamirensis]KHJ53611.1 MFS transporter [Aureimonas altamirensis]
MKAALHSMAAPTNWTAISVIVGSGIAAALQVGKGAIAAPMLQDDLGIDLTAIGWFAGIFALIGLFGGIPAGAFAARFGARRILMIGLLVTALGGALGAALPGLPSLFIGRVIEGAGFLLVTVAAPSLIGEVARPADRDLAFALWSCFMPVGMASAMLAGPLFGDWRAMWWASCALALAICATVPLVIPASEQSRSMSFQSLRHDTLIVLSDRRAVGLSLTFALFALMFFAVFSFLPVLLMERLRVTHQTAGLLSALVLAVNVIGNLAAGMLLSRGLGRTALLIAACLVMGLAGSGIFLPVLPDAAAFALCLLFSAFGGVIPTILLSSAPVVAPAAGLVPVVLGLILQGNNLGQILGPTAIGAAQDRLGWESAAYIVAAAAMTAVILVRSTLTRIGPESFNKGGGER